jgi:hypothetical protein
MNYEYAAKEKAAYYTMSEQTFKPASLNSRKIANGELPQ